MPNFQRKIVCDTCVETVYIHVSQKRPICDACAIALIAANPTLSPAKMGFTASYAKKRGYISTRQPSTRHRIKKTYVRKNAEVPACKIVVCEPMNTHRDALREAFPYFDIEAFDEVRLKVMTALCHEHVRPSTMAAAIVYYLCRILRKNVPQRTIARVAGTSPISVRTYFRRITEITGYCPSPLGRTRTLSSEVVPPVKRKRGRPRKKHAPSSEGTIKISVPLDVYAWWEKAGIPMQELAMDAITAHVEKKIGPCEEA